MAASRERAQPPGPAVETTDDAVLGGRLRLLQPRRGHRVGHDAMLLAAAAGGADGEHAVEFGAGVGAAGLALAQRIPGLAVTLVEIDRALAALADENVRRNGFAERVRVVTLDVEAPAAAYADAGLAAGVAHHILMNPPFRDADRQQASPDPARSLAHHAAGGAEAVLTAWLGSAHRLLVPSGTLTLIWQAVDLPLVVAALAPAFGAVTVLPVHPKPTAPAIRILVRAVKDARAPFMLLPGLLLADEDGRPTAAAEAVLRGGAPLLG